MHDGDKQPPRTAVQHVAAGMMLMAIFSLVGVGVAETGLKQVGYTLVGLFFSIISLILLLYALYLFAVARSCPAAMAVEEKALWKKITNWYEIISGSVILTVCVMVGLLISLHRGALIIPAIALAVGLHLFLLSRVFKRSIDYYVATWTCIVALGGLYLTWRHLLSEIGVVALLGIGLAISTLAYGLMFLVAGYRLTKY